jgi:HEAT repeat protein
VPIIHDPRQLDRIREHALAVNSPAHRAVLALEGWTETDPGEAVSELAHAYKSQADNTVTVLVYASHDERPAVRKAAAAAMSVHPYGMLRDRLAELEEDPSDEVREAAARALVEMRDFRPGCLQCGSEGYDLDGAVHLPDSSDPHGAFVDWPVFCSKDCAVEYACNRVREDVDADELHECLAGGAWRREPEEECEVCEEADDFGRPLPPEEQAEVDQIERINQMEREAEERRRREPVVVD